MRGVSWGWGWVGFPAPAPFLAVPRGPRGGRGAGSAPGGGRGGACSWRGQSCGRRAVAGCPAGLPCRCGPGCAPAPVPRCAVAGAGPAGMRAVCVGRRRPSGAQRCRPRPVHAPRCVAPPGGLGLGGGPGPGALRARASHSRCRFLGALAGVCAPGGAPGRVGGRRAHPPLSPGARRPLAVCRLIRAVRRLGARGFPVSPLACLREDRPRLAVGPSSGRVVVLRGSGLRDAGGAPSCAAAVPARCDWWCFSLRPGCPLRY